MVHNPVECRDYLGDLGRTDGVAHFDVENLSVGSHAQEVASSRAGTGVGGSAIVTAGDDSSNVGAVAEQVEITQIFARAVEREVGAIDDLVFPAKSIDANDAGVDECHSDAVTGVAPVPVDDRVDDLGIDGVH